MDYVLANQLDNILLSDDESIDYIPVRYQNFDATKTNYVGSYGEVISLPQQR